MFFAEAIESMWLLFLSPQPADIATEFTLFALMVLAGGLAAFFLRLAVVHLMRGPKEFEWILDPDSLEPRDPFVRQGVAFEFKGREVVTATSSKSRINPEDTY